MLLKRELAPPCICGACRVNRGSWLDSIPMAGADQRTAIFAAHASILLVMQTDPMEQWRRLTRHYAEMTDGELLNLAADYADLTEMARQVLRDEMRKRELDEPVLRPSNRPDGAGWSTGGSEPLPASANGQRNSPGDFVWKNVLCECSDREEAWQIAEVLRRAGIETWIDQTQMYSTPLSEVRIGRFGPRVLVAFDCLDHARAILAQPIPQDIIEQSRAEHSEYKPPACPGCGAPDPLLEGVDPSNAWKCEVCGRQWSEPVGEAAS